MRLRGDSVALTTLALFFLCGSALKSSCLCLREDGWAFGDGMRRGRLLVLPAPVRCVITSRSLSAPHGR